MLSTQIPERQGWENWNLNWIGHGPQDAELKWLKGEITHLQFKEIKHSHTVGISPTEFLKQNTNKYDLLFQIIH